MDIVAMKTILPIHELTKSIETQFFLLSLHLIFKTHMIVTDILALEAPNKLHLPLQWFLFISMNVVIKHSFVFLRS